MNPARLNPTDRNDINSLVAIAGSSRDRRDASNSAGPWKNKPTAIPSPHNNQRTTQRRLTHAEQLDPSLHFLSQKQKERRFGNATAQSVVASTVKGQPSKKRRIDETPRAATPILPPRMAKNKYKMLSEVPPLGPENLHDDQDIINLVDDEGNTTTDDLNMSSPSRPMHISSEEYAYKDVKLVSSKVSSSHNRHMNATAGPSQIAQDGKATKWVEQQYWSSDYDSIEQFPSEDAALKRNAKGSNVKRKIDLFEKNGPRLDLVEMNKKVSIKKGMQPKEPRRTTWLDPIATSATPFTTSSAQHPKIQKNNISQKNHLPVQDIYIGLTHYATREDKNYLVHWAASQLLLFKESSGKNVLKLDPSYHLDKLTCTDLNENETHLIQLRTITPNSRHNAQPNNAFKLGDARLGLITLRFNTKDPHWSEANYQALIHVLREQISDKSTIRKAAAETLFTKADRASQMYEVTSKRSELQSSVMQTSEENRRPPKRSAPDDDETWDEASPPPVESLITGMTRRRQSARTEELESHDHKRSNPARRSTRKANASPKPDPDEVILVYPQGIPGAVNITNADLSRLQPGEFLNDTLIEFGLKLWLRELERSHPELVKQIHVFSSFFYKKLNKRKTEEGYETVRKWTSKFDIFDKKYIIVPINENLHWYLAIIYEPEHVLLPPPPAVTPSTRQKSKLLTADKPPSRILFEPVATPELIAEEALVAETSITPNTEVSDSSSQMLSEAEVEKSCFDFKAKVTISQASEKLRLGSPLNIDSAPSPTEETRNIQQSSSPLSPLTEDEMEIDELESTPEGSQLSPTVSDFGPPAPDEQPNPATMKSEAIPPALFYGHSASNAKGKEKAIPYPEPLPMDVVHVEVEEEEHVQAQTFTQPKTRIFTLDSLGSEHRHAIRQLRIYLKLEARDKKGIDISNTSDAEGRVAPVPVQPNFCDCGIYLLHLAQTFMTDPQGYFQTILKSKKNMPNAERQVIWHDDQIASIRENLNTRIRELSVEWKKERVAKEEVKKKEAQEAKPDAELVESSDDDIDIVEMTPPPGKNKSKPLPKRKTIASTPAERIRG
ncbi:hypothetical protein BDQ12DRAFT_462220 [Crucibulum laeve]|uniref:Ubiquitin-like protease family profile domain-containing protein n=1 Tax=Crucibulum laeve TaxID=68775 RepID=A0A5C3M7I9_9AGAR|nr:hypothetical protein BDQ12DRAFT_462220 [Crucibulum laeve]